MTTWEDVVKFLYAKGLGDVIVALLDDCPDEIEAKGRWHDNNTDIWNTVYPSDRAKMDDMHANDLRYARQLDKGD